MIQFDKTSEFENRLRQSGYQQLEPFFVLREGVIQDERNGGVVRLDKSRLEKIAAIQNQRIAETGDATPIIIGHTKKGKKESEQPELTGWATRFDVVPFHQTGTYGLRAVPWSRPEKIENYEKYPRRSAELWTDPDLLDPISLLGPNTPRLDLGLHRLQRSTDNTLGEYRPRTPIYLEMDTMPPPIADTDAAATGSQPAGGEGGKSSACAEVFNSPEWKQMQQQIGEFAEIASIIKPMLQDATAQGAGEGANGPGAMPPGGPPGAMPPPGGGGGAMPPPPGGGGMPPAQMGGHPALPNHQPTPPHQFNYGAGGSPAGGMNTQMPHQMSRGTAPQHPGYDPRDQELAQLRQQVAVMERQQAAMQLSIIEQSVNTVLDDLEDKIAIDRPRDFARLVQMSRADQEVEVQFMLQTRKPIEVALPPEAVPIHMQALGTPQGAARGPMGPVQMTMGQAHDALGMPPDPTLAAAAGKPTSRYDQLQEIVRNRGKLGNMAAYEYFMSQQAGNNGTAVRS